MTVRVGINGALEGIAVRVPAEDGSFTDLAVLLRRATTTEEINAAFTDAAEGPLRGILRVSTVPIVSRDVGDPTSCVFDPALTLRSGARRRLEDRLRRLPARSPARRSRPAAPLRRTGGLSAIRRRQVEA